MTISKPAFSFSIQVLMDFQKVMELDAAGFMKSLIGKFVLLCMPASLIS